MKRRLTISIVTHNNEKQIEKALASIYKSDLPPGTYYIKVMDNDSTDKTIGKVSLKSPYISLIVSPNIGFGGGHNKVIRNIKGKSEYHLVMNPDVTLNPDTLGKLLDFMDKNPDVGLTMPKVLYPDGTLQHLCKRLPTPFDLIGRRFIPGFLKFLFKKRLGRYELRDKDYEQVMEVPYLSGCFMFLRADVFDKVGFFDERFFLYLEDVDFCRRIHAKFKTVYYPHTFIYHEYRKGSYEQLINLFYHMQSAVKYFNKWGWFKDPEREKINDF